MRVGIVTLYNAFNYGAYLQAYALQKVIKGLGHEVEFINLENWSTRRARYATLFSKNPIRLLFNFKRYLAFHSSWAKLNVASEAYAVCKPYYDAAVIGSDEIWNIKNPQFVSLPEFFGKNLNAGRIIAYAPSLGEMRFIDLAKRQDIIAGLNNISNFSARDKNTYEFVEKAVHREVTLVLDPTFLTNYEDEEEQLDLNGYILVYTYKFDDGKIRKTKQFAMSRGLRLVSPCFYNAWCDDVVTPTPFGFLGLVRNADYVITNTFHGSIFSIFYRKQFGAFAGEKIKVWSLLSNLDLMSRNLSNVECLDEVMFSPIDYETVNASIAKKRDISMKFLERALEL